MYLRLISLLSPPWVRPYGWTGWLDGWLERGGRLLHAPLVRPYGWTGWLDGWL